MRGNSTGFELGRGFFAALASPTLCEGASDAVSIVMTDDLEHLNRESDCVVQLFYKVCVSVCTWRCVDLNSAVAH
jgi:hypothetical protein